MWGIWWGIFKHLGLLSTAEIAQESALIYGNSWGKNALIDKRGTDNHRLFVSRRREKYVSKPFM